MRRHLAVLSLLVLGAGVTLPAQRLPIKPYTTADGLAHNNVNRIVRDSRGFLWFCTADGLSRFDGYAFTTFGTGQGLPHSNVTDVLETRAGDYWVATEGGLVRFDPKGTPDPRVALETEAVGRHAMFTTVLPDGADDAGRRARATTVLREGHDGTIWVGTNDGLYRLVSANGQRTLKPVEIGLPRESPQQRAIAAVLEDAAGSLWVGAPSGLYRRWPDGSTARYTQQDGLPGSVVQDLLEDHEGHLWAGTRLTGFFRFSADETHRAPAVTLAYNYRPDDPAGLSTTWIFQLFEASDHRFWIATARGLTEFFPNGDDQGRRFHAYTERNGLSYFDITAVAEDLGGNLWMGTNNAGAMKLTLRGLSTYGDQDGVEMVNAIFEDRAGDLCFRGHVLGDQRTSIFEGAKLDLLRGEPATKHARLGCFDAERFDWFGPPGLDDQSWGWVSEQVTLQARTGEWWVGTARGLERYSTAEHLPQITKARLLARYTARDGLAENQVFRLFEDSHGSVWVSTFNGLARWEPADETLHDVTHSPGLPSFEDDRPRSFAEDASGTVWIGFNNGLARYSHGTFTTFAAGEGLPPGAIANMHVDRSARLWLASTQSGLVRVDHTETDRPAFVSYTIAQGLSSNNTAVITEDLQGHIYVGGGKGLDRLDPTTSRVRHFTTADGIGSGTFLAAFRDRRGVLWFGMSSGLARLVPASDRPATPPPTLITGVRVSGTPQPMSALGERDLSLPDLASDRNQLQIDFVGFRPGDVMSYQFRLQGADADWSAAAESRAVTYAGLSPGRYTFLVRAVNADGVVSDPPASIAFRILPPFWQRWWFLLLTAIVVGSAIQALYRYRVTRLLEMANMRTRIATDLHDDIGANLTRIALLTEVAKQSGDGAGSSHADGPLASIARIARESVSSMSDIVWAINPKRESLLDLTWRMRQHADEVFTLRDIELQFDAPTAADHASLRVDLRRDLLLIFKEAVNNAARHSGCSRVEIHLHIEGSRLRLAIADDGAGFDSSSDQDGQGLASMQRRAQRLSGTLVITSARGAGTRIALDVPL